MGHYILTRPKDQASASADTLKARGYSVLNAPMAEPVALTFEIPDTRNAIVVTSRNGVKFGLNLMSDFGRPVFAVGDKTAEDARELGFYNVHVGTGTARGLMEQLKAFYKETGKPITHLRGEDLAFRVAGNLQRFKVKADDRITYSMKPTGVLPEDVLDALRAEEVRGVLFYSAKAADRFEDLMARNNMTGHLRQMVAYCLSDRIQASLLGPWLDVQAAKFPDENILFDLLPPA